jgi:serine/threonine protein kinase
MGVVYLARHRTMGRLEVLKVLTPQQLNRPGARDRFLREIRAAARLDHHNVVRAYSVQELGRLLVLAMEYIDGPDLARVVRTGGPLPVPLACDYLGQVLAGLQHAHENDLVHRDIKPANLIRRREGDTDRIKILDFGLAKASAEAVKGKFTEPGQMLGTPAFMAPEQAVSAATADIRADIYSAGCTLYYLLTGQPPFPGRDVVEVVTAHLHRPIPKASAVRPGIPEELDAVLTRMLAKNPEERHATPAEAGTELASASRIASVRQGADPAYGPPITTIDLSTSQDETSRIGSARSARPWWLLAGLPLALIVLGLTVGLSHRVVPSTHPTEPSPVELVAPPRVSDQSASAPGNEPKVRTNQPRQWARRLNGDWRVDRDRGEIVQLDPRVEFAHLGLLAPNVLEWTDYDFTVEARRIGPGDQFAMLVRTDPKVGNYLFAVGAERSTACLLELHRDGRGNRNWKVIASQKHRIVENLWYTALVRVRGSQIECTLTGPMGKQLVSLSTTNNENPRGGVSLRTVYSSYVFRNLKVTRPEGSVLWAGLPEVIVN